MSKTTLSRFSLLLALLMLLSPFQALAQDAAVLDAPECVTEFDETVDYFDDKAELLHAETFSIEYFNNYKVITVNTPWTGATDADGFQYVLVQCGTPAPEGYDDAQVIEVPASSIISLSSSIISPLADLGLIDQLVGVDSAMYINNADVVAKAEAGELLEVGSGATINVEQVLDSEASIVMVNGSGFPEYDAHPVLIDAGVFVAVNADWVEPTLLGRAEWIKFVGAFYNQEAAATVLYDTILSDYEETAALVADLDDEEKLTVLWNSYQAYTESWSIPGQETWVGALLQDAGVNWVGMEEAPTDSAQLSYEAVYDAGAEAPLWVINGFGIATLDDLLASDERAAEFAAFQNGAVYDNNARSNAFGGNDYWETGVNHPELLLKDLVALFYPDLLPDHESVFYNKLAE